MSVGLERMDHPFTPTDKLQQHCLTNNLEYATCGREKHPMPLGTFVWKIATEGVQEAGFAWLDEPKDDPKSRNILMAVYTEHCGKGLGTSVLRKIEEELPQLGIMELRAQINNNAPTSGLLVRRWLKREGFVLYDRRSSFLWDKLTDDQFLEKCFWPVHLKKTYAAAIR